MKLKRTFTFLVLVSLLLTSAFVGVLQVSAAYDYLFPVNNGGVIGYVYGYSESYGSFHVGIDLHARTGDDTIYAAYSGTVGATADSCYHVSYGAACEHYSTFGNYIRINQDDGTYAYYGHLKQYSLLVKVGDRVVKGQPIATMGSSGYSTGKHLHFEVRTNRSDSSSHINVNSKELGGLINYSYTGYGATASYTYEDIADGVYYLKNAGGKYMSVDGGAESNGQNVSAASFSATDAFKLDFKKTANGYVLRPLCAENSVINNYGSTVSNGNNVTLWETTDHASQKWNFEAVEGGYVIRSAMNPECCIAVDSGNNVYVATYTGASGQIWNIENTVDFDVNGGEGEFETLFKDYGTELTIPEATPEREGYKFLGWATDSDAAFANYGAGSTYASNQNAVLCAVWVEVDGNIGDNLAYLKSYTISGTGAGYGDYTADLTDGEYASAVAYDDSWFALYYYDEAKDEVINSPNGVGTIVIDLEAEYDLNAVNLHFINIGHASVGMPESVKIYLSADGEEYTPAGVMPLSSEDSVAYWSFNSIDGNARYVKLEFVLGDLFCFINEIEVYGNEIGAEPPVVTGDLGDVNLDGTIDQFDYLLVKRHYFETRYLTDDELTRADVNADGEVNQFDYILIKRHYFGTYVIG